MSAEQHRKNLIAKCASLSPREKQVLRDLAQRRRAKEIARDLKISEHTVRGYANEARQKLGLSSNRDAALIFLEYERQQSTPQIQGEHFQRVPPHHSFDAPSEGGFSKTVREVEAQELETVLGFQAEASVAFVELAPQDRLTRLHAWLARLSLARWLGLTVLVTLGVIMAFGLAAVTVLGVFEVLQQIGSQHR